MKRKKTNKPKLSQKVREQLHWAQNGYCCIDGCYNKITEFHHIKSQSVENCKKWPLFIHSPFNVVGICHTHHNSEAIYLFKISDKLAEVYEDWLYSLKHNILEE